ncbi:hypothetical protein [uncultured Tessaracoccus sp.]|uniref:hypothetical protein n=1 Tax=uncultured Tessaracoccus sp. TaxID=905023 RepID=UPI0025D4AE53|nr:hypothetical protein [uncultured Tessaracoccus sp.]
MSPDDSTITSTDAAPHLVDIEWADDGPLSVAATNRWLDAREPYSLLTSIRRAADEHYRAHLSSAGTDLRIGSMPLSALRELTTLIREARAERDAAPEPIEQVVEGRRGRSTWRGGLLHQLDVDTDWLRRASKQAISEEFMTLLARPDAPDTTPTPAQDRLARFVKEYA